MRAEQDPWIILNLDQFRDRINPNPEYQRPPGRWSLANEQLLIDSILRGYDLPKFYLADSKEDGFDWEIVDGQQRIRAIWRFINDEYPLSDDCDEFDEWGDLSARYYSRLPIEAQKAFGMFKLSIVILKETSTTELEDLFRRLQKGKRITPVEYRNAISGEIRNFAVELGDKHRVFRATKFKSTGWKWRDLVDHVLCLEMAGGPTDIKAKNLQVMYEQRRFPRDKDVRGKVKRVLNYMAKVLKRNSPFMNIKWGFVDLYLLISVLIEKYDLSGLEEEFAEFYDNFEADRRQAIKGDIKSLASGNYWERVLFDYIQSFSKQGALKENIQRRHSVYMSWFLNHLGNKNIELTFKDPKRTFDDIDRSVIWYLAGGTCVSCGKKLQINEMHADHIVPHSRGGQTIITNGQCLCADCNNKKGARIVYNG